MVDVLHRKIKLREPLYGNEPWNYFVGLVEAMELAFIALEIIAKTPSTDNCNHIRAQDALKEIDKINVDQMRY